MAARDVAGFMGDDADDFLVGLGFGEEAGVDEYALAAGHEGVDAVVGDDIDFHGVRVDAGRLENGARILAEQTFNFSVADKVGAGLLLRRGFAGFGKGGGRREGYREDGSEEGFECGHDAGF